MAWVPNARLGGCMVFSIQASNPKFKTSEKIKEKHLSEAVESIFPLNTESAIISWNHIAIPLSYKYDISYMLTDILLLIGDIQNKDNGKKIVRWLPDTFRCNWMVEWDDKWINIDTYWECTVGHLEEILNKKSDICIDKFVFLGEWKQVLGIVIEGLVVCGYNKEELEGMTELIEKYEKIGELGILYKE